MISFAVHEKPLGVQKKMLAEADRLLAPQGTVILVDFSLDRQASPMGKIGTTLVERMAGAEHYRNFKTYVKRGGMPLDSRPI